MIKIIRNNILNRFVKLKNHIVYVEVLQYFFPKGIDQLLF